MGDGLLGKAFAILRHVAEAGRPLGAAEIARRLDLNISTVHRVAQTLVAGGALRYDSERRAFGVGVGFLRLAALALNSSSIADILRPALQRLVDMCDETAGAYLYDPAEAALHLVISVESRHPLGYAMDVGRSDYLHAGASGKAILAFLPDEECRSVLARRGMPQITPATTVSQTQLMGDLARIRERGYAISRGERVPGAVGIAAPIIAGTSGVLGSILLTVPIFRYDAGQEERFAVAVRAVATEISDLMRAKTATSTSSTGLQLQASAL